MSKNYISEERLRQLIQESITEVLMENENDEGLGRFLGNAYQWAKNKWNNFKGDFNAARNYQRYKNRDYDPFEHYGDEADEIRNFGGREYGAYRYNQARDRNNSARQYDRTINRNNSQNTDMVPHPGHNNNNNNNQEQQPETPVQQPETPVQQQPEAPVQQQPETQPQTKRDEVEARFKNQNYPRNPQSWMRTTEPSDAVYGKQMAIRNLKRVGIVPQNGNWNKPSGWKNVNGGKLTPDQKKTIQTYNKFLYEEKLNELNKILNEIKTIRLKKK